MKAQFKIDALRFALQFKKKHWKSHSAIEMVDVSTGKIRLLDTKEGKNCLVIIPDGPNVIEHYFDLVKSLSDDFRIIVFELPGIGFSTHKGSYDYSFQKTSFLISELFDLLKIERANLSFPCANGFYGLAFAKAYPEKVAQLILLQTPSVSEMNNWSGKIIPSYLKKPFLSQLIMPFVEKKFATQWYNYALPKGIDRQPYRETALDGLKNGGNFCLCSLTQGLMGQNESLLEVDPSIPTTLIYGKNDFTHSLTNFESIKQYHEHIDIVGFENCGHFPDLEQQGKYIQLLRDKIKA